MPVTIILSVVIIAALCISASFLTVANNEKFPTYATAASEPSVASNNVTTNQTRSNTGFGLPIQGINWKVSSTLGFVDWSPVDNIFAVGNEVYGSAGQKLFTFSSVSREDGFGYAKFSPTGLKIAYFNIALYGEPTSQLYIFDIKSKTTQSVKLGSNITDLAWGQDDNTIYYGTLKLTPNPPPYSHLEILKYDLKTGDESVVLVTASGINFDVSHDGKNVVYNYVGIGNPECTDYFGTHPCYSSRLVVQPLNSGGNLTASDPADSHVILTGMVGYPAIGYPRWTPDDASITVVRTPSVLHAYPCNSIVEVTRDGSAKVELYGFSKIDGCYDSNIAYNKDQTMIVYGRRDSNGFPDGTYLSISNQSPNFIFMIGIGAAIAGAVVFLILRKRKKFPKGQRFVAKA